MNSDLGQLVGRFSRARIAAVGDLVADEFIYGETERISREAPVLIVRYESAELKPGCGANAVMNLCALGAQVQAVGLCHSVMFPTIFTLGIRGLGPLTEEGSGLLIMAIAGGALSALQGVIADHVGLQLSYLLPAACYVYVLFYALWGSRVREVLPKEELTT